MPQNTPTIYLVVGLLALVGALVGALGQIGTAALQRRHDRWLKLEDVRREAYAQLLLALDRLGDSLKAKRVDSGRRERIDKVHEIGSKIEVIASPKVLEPTRRLLQHLAETYDLDERLRNELANACRVDVGAAAIDLEGLMSPHKITTTAGKITVSVRNGKERPRLRRRATEEPPT